MRKKTVGLTTKKHCKIVWDNLGVEYYSEAHKTSRNFDAVINHYLPKTVPELHSDCLYLDLGGGKGRLQELGLNRNSDVIVGDFSIPMMRADHDRPRTTSFVQMDAFNLPFKSNTFHGVFSLVGDSYALGRAFEEVSRTLKVGGFFMLTLPTKIWRQNLISTLGIKEDETIFGLRNGMKLKVPSFLYSPGNLKEILLSSGFGKVEVGEWKSFNVIQRSDYSKHIVISARNLGLAPEELPLITYAIALKDQKCGTAEGLNHAR